MGNGSGQREATGRTDGTVETPCHHNTSRIAWAELLARSGGQSSLACPMRGGDIPLISFINQPETIRKILTHVGEPIEPRTTSPTRGPTAIGANWCRLMMAAISIRAHLMSYL